MTQVSTTPRKHARIETVDKYMSRSPHTIGVEQPLEVAHRMMRDYKIRHLPVLEGGRLVGIVSDRDLKLIEVLKTVDTRKVTVSEAMSTEVYQVEPLAPLESVARTMSQKKYGSVVVVEGERVVGIFTAVDALEALAWALEQRN